MKKLAIWTVLGMVVLTGCKNEEEQKNISTPLSAVVITNEGLYGSGVGTVSIYDPEMDTVQNEVFNKVNGFPTGNVLHSATIEGNDLYLVVNNSGKVEVCNTDDMVSTGMISGFTSPRYLKAVSSDKAYVTDWFDNNVKVVDLATKSIVKTIPTGTGPENMALTNGGKLFVTNTGGWDTDSTVTVIDAVNDTVLATLELGYLPQSVQLDRNGKVWVLCSGKADWSDPMNGLPGELYRINPDNYSVELKLTFSSNSLHPAHLKVGPQGDVLYYISDLYGGALMKMDISASVLPTTPMVNKAFYSLGVHPQNGEIYAGDAIDFVQSGTVYRYNNTGDQLDSVKVGIIPGNFEFK